MDLLSATMSRDSAGDVRYPVDRMDSVVAEARTEADERFDTARITAAVDALAEKHAGREDISARRWRNS